MHELTISGGCVGRGGSWYFQDNGTFQARYHPGLNPSNWIGSLGFRCIAPVDSAATQKFQRIK